MAAITDSTDLVPAMPSGRPPRLLLTFAILSGIALAVAAVVALVLARMHAVDQAEDESWTEARAIAERLGRDDLARTAVQRPAYGQDVAQLDDLFGVDALGPGIKGVTLYARDGRITYATDHRGIGKPAPDSEAVEEALAGERVSRRSGDLLESYVPVRWLLADPTFPSGVLAVARDYAPVAEEARDDFLYQAGTIALALLLLYGASFPALRRVTRTLEERNRRLAEQADELQALTEQASDAIFVTDRQGVVLDANEQASRLTGRARGELAGVSFGDLLDPADLQARPLRLPELHAGEIVLHERRFQRPDGELVIGEVHARMLDDGRVFASVRDVTQLRRAQRAESVGRLAGGAAHDFSNLLTGIGGYAERLIARLPEDDPLRREAEEIRKATAQGASLTRQLLVFGRRRVEQPILIDANEAVGDAGRMLGRLLGEDIALEIRPAAGPAPLEIDPGQLEQLVVTLALSARESMPSGGALTIDVVDDARFVRIAARDSGVGHGRDLKFELNEPYTGAEGGSLAYVGAIAESLGGWVDVESGPAGSTVTVSLPRADVPLTMYDPVAKVSGARGSETVLVVEDEELVRAVIREILEDAGYTVIGARHGRQALELAAEYEGPIDLLVTDLVMPELGGRELAAELAKTRPATGVIFMSGYPDDAAVAHGVLEADASFLQKPFTHDELARKVRDVLDGQDRRAADLSVA
jgi:PAS domain S-box-containing protein